MRWAAGLEYVGTRYSGWQWQGHASSIQQEVERVLGNVADHPLKISAAGRTDAGVHAFHQVIHFDSDAPRAPHAWLFGEDQARYIIETDAVPSIQLAASQAGVPIQRIGTVGGAALTLPGGGAISVAQLKAAHEAWLPGYMHQG